MNEELREAEERKAALFQRLKEARTAAETAQDPKERRTQQERVRLLREMYRDACGDVNRLAGNAPKARKRTVRGDAIFQTNAVWSDIEGTTWSKVDEAAWSEIVGARREALTGRQSSLLTTLLNDGVQCCTELQKRYLGAYYIQGKTMPEIAAEHDTHKSSVSRAMKRGLARIAHHVIARLTIARCIDGDGKFDYLKFVRTTAVLSERQTELVYLALTQDASYRRIAAYVGRKPSTISHAMGRAEEKLSSVRVDFLPEINVTGVRFEDWSGLTETELAERLGLSRRFFYTAIRRGERIDGIPLLHYHILCRARGGWSAAETARELGASPALCKRVAHQYGAVRLDPARLPAYQPAERTGKPEKGNVLAALRELTGGGDQIIDHLDQETVRKVRERVC